MCVRERESEGVGGGLGGSVYGWVGGCVWVCVGACGCVWVSGWVANSYERVTHKSGRSRAHSVCVGGCVGVGGCGCVGVGVSHELI